MIARLSEAGFRLLPAFETTTHCVLEREGFVCLVEKRRDGAFGNAGSPGLFDDGVLCVLTWKRQGPCFVGANRVGKNKELPATTEQLEALRKFDAELREALRPPAIAPKRD